MAQYKCHWVRPVLQFDFATLKKPSDVFERCHKVLWHVCKCETKNFITLKYYEVSFGTFDVRILFTQFTCTDFKYLKFKFCY